MTILPDGTDAQGANFVATELFSVARFAGLGLEVATVILGLAGGYVFAAAYGGFGSILGRETERQ